MKYSMPVVRRRNALWWVVGVLGVVAMLVVVGTAATHSGGAKFSAAGRIASMPDAAASSAASGPMTLKPDIGGGAATGSGAQDAVAAALVDPRVLIRTASISLQVRKGQDVNTVADRADAIAVAAGGAVYGDDRTSGDDATATLTLKVPPQSLPTVLTQLSGLGIEQARTQSTQDVTQTVADVDSRVRSARAAVATLTALYQRATTIGEIVSIETQLSQRQSDLEAVEAQQRALAAQTSLATISVTLSTKPVAPPPPKPAQKGFVAGLKTGWKHFVSGAVATATVLGALLPFVVLLAVVLLAVRVALRLRPRRPAPASVTSTGAAVEPTE